MHLNAVGRIDRVVGECQAAAKLPPLPPAAAAAVQNGVAVGQECPTCMRGVLATKSFEDDDVIMKLPYSVMIAFK